MESVILRRSGQAPLRFMGRVLDQGSSHAHNTQLQNRWHEVEVFETDQGQYVVAIHYRTQWQGEHDHDQASVVSAASDVPAVLTGYDPLAAVSGFPPGDAYADKQRRLEDIIRAGYDALVSSVLQDERYAVPPAQAQAEQYWGLDQQAVQEFVRCQLADFPLSKGEACALCDANNGAMLFPEKCWMGLAMNIQDTPASSLSEKWECDASALARRIHAADRGTQFALAWAVAQFWRHCEMETDEALKLAGFMVRRPVAGPLTQKGE